MNPTVCAGPVARLTGWLFPRESRHFPGRRWVNITLRSLHLLGIAGLGGGFLYGLPLPVWEAYLWLAVATGSGLALLQIWSNGIWLVQVRGIAIMCKLLLLAAAAWGGAPRPAILVAVIAISGVIAHAPANVRYFSPWHGRRVDSLPR